MNEQNCKYYGIITLVDACGCRWIDTKWWESESDRDAAFIRQTGPDGNPTTRDARKEETCGGVTFLIPDSCGPKTTLRREIARRLTVPPDWCDTEGEMTIVFYASYVMFAGFFLLVLVGVVVIACDFVAGFRRGLSDAKRERRKRHDD